MNWSQTRSIFEKSAKTLHEDSNEAILSKQSRREATKSVTLSNQDRVDLLKQKQKDMFHMTRLQRLKSDQQVRNSKTRKPSVLSKSNLGIIPHTHCQQTLASRVKMVPKPRKSPNLSSQGATKSSQGANYADWKASKLKLPTGDAEQGENTLADNIQFIKNDRKQTQNTQLKGVTNSNGVSAFASGSHCRVPSHVVKKSANRRPRNERISRQKQEQGAEVELNHTRKVINNDLNIFTQSSLGDISQTASSSHNSKQVSAGTTTSFATLINQGNGAFRSLSRNQNVQTNNFRTHNQTSQSMSRSITEVEGQACYNKAKADLLNSQKLLLNTQQHLFKRQTTPTRRPVRQDKKEITQPKRYGLNGLSQAKKTRSTEKRSDLDKFLTSGGVLKSQGATKARGHTKTASLVPLSTTKMCSQAKITQNSCGKMSSASKKSCFSVTQSYYEQIRMVKMQRENGKKMLKSASMITSKFNTQHGGSKLQNLKMLGTSEMSPIPGFSQSTKFLDSGLSKSLTKHELKGKNKIQRPSTQCEGASSSTQNDLSLKSIIENQVFKQNLVGGSANHTRSHEECAQKFNGSRISQTINCGKDLGLDEELLASLPANLGDQEQEEIKDNVHHNTSLMSDQMISLDILKQQISPEKDPNYNSTISPPSQKSNQKENNLPKELLPLAQMSFNNGNQEFSLSPQFEKDIQVQLPSQPSHVQRQVNRKQITGSKKPNNIFLKGIRGGLSSQNSNSSSFFAQKRPQSALSTQPNFNKAKTILSEISQSNKPSHAKLSDIFNKTQSLSKPNHFRSKSSLLMSQNGLSIQQKSLLTTSLNQPISGQKPKDNPNKRSLSSTIDLQKKPIARPKSFSVQKLPIKKSSIGVQPPQLSISKPQFEKTHNFRPQAKPQKVIPSLSQTVFQPKIVQKKQPKIEQKSSKENDGNNWGQVTKIPRLDLTKTEAFIDPDSSKLYTVVPSQNKNLDSSISESFQTFDSSQVLTGSNSKQTVSNMHQDSIEAPSLIPKQAATKVSIDQSAEQIMFNAENLTESASPLLKFKDETEILLQPFNQESAENFRRIQTLTSPEIDPKKLMMSNLTIHQVEQSMMSTPNQGQKIPENSNFVTDFRKEEMTLNKKPQFMTFQNGSSLKKPKITNQKSNQDSISPSKKNSKPINRKKEIENFDIQSVKAELDRIRANKKAAEDSYQHIISRLKTPSLQSTAKKRNEASIIVSQKEDSQSPEKKDIQTLTCKIDIPCQSSSKENTKSAQQTKLVSSQKRQLQLTDSVQSSSMIPVYRKDDTPARFLVEDYDPCLEEENSSTYQGVSPYSETKILRQENMAPQIKELLQGTRHFNLKRF